MRRCFALAATTSLAVVPCSGQDIQNPVVDTIVISTRNVFDATNIVFRIANAIHFTTRPGVVRRELLFRSGQAYDSAAVAESERNLRRLGVFRAVVIDTARIGRQLAAVVRTADGWSTQVQFNARSTGGRFAWSAGATETNVFGTANRVSVLYRDDPDRTSVSLLVGINRLFSSRTSVDGLFQDFSDGAFGAWRVGVPFRAFADRQALEVSGEAADRRILQFRVNNVTDVDTTEFRRRAFASTLAGALAVLRESGRYVRVGAGATVRREEYVFESERGLGVPDTVTGAVSVFGEYRQAHFKVVTHYNGFAHQEDLDLSTVARATLWFAPSTFGYQRSGIGPSVIVSSAVAFPFGFVRATAIGNGLFTGAGLDSGRVQVQLTGGAQFLPRQATFVHFRAGVQERPPPGGEFDLGFGVGPRGFGPHAFTGTRAVWGTFEHRAFLWDDIGGVLGIGLAGFLDYGGAWFPDQPARAGGTVGLGLRTGFSRASGANIGRIDLGYRFGDGVEDKRWVVSFGRGLLF